MKKELKKAKTHKEIAQDAQDDVTLAVDIQQLEKTLSAKTKRSHHVVIHLDDVNKTFVTGQAKSVHIHVLKDISLKIYAGEFAIIYGPSGCGKSTLLHTILGLEPPSRGKVFLRDEDLYKFSSDDRTSFRREKVGMVFQQSNWIKALTVLENVMYPLWLSGYNDAHAKERAMIVLEEVGMSSHINYRPTELSGGQQQRVALARALSTDPWILVADEPTGNLDTVASTEIMSLFTQLNRKKSRLVVMVTHDVSYLPLATRRIGMRDGKIVFDEHD
jgi:putative ABC transport system ATP-binding protein